MEESIPETSGISKVTRDEAREIANTQYGLQSLTYIDRRSLTEEEVSEASSQGSANSTIYYVIAGAIEEEEKVTIFVSSINLDDHFIIYETE